MKDTGGRILYTGKAKNLRKRLTSYFQDTVRLTPKTRHLVGRIAAIDILLTATEKEALLLEESLIKKHRPRYNIVLRDDKKYILVRISKGHEYPRLSLTRRVERDGAVYFGPFTSADAARQTVQAIHRLFPLRRCKETVFRNRVRPCVYHDIGACLAPCVGQVAAADYRRMVRKAELFLSGRAGELLASLEEEMQAASVEMAFERAAVVRDQMAAVRRTVERQAVVLPGGVDLDAAELVAMSQGLALGVLFVRDGRMLGHKTFFWPGLGLDEGPEVLASFLLQFYHPGRVIPPRLLLPTVPEDGTLATILAERRESRISLSTPRTAQERALLDLVRQNALEEMARATQRDPAEGLRERLHLRQSPRRIECVDASHLGGTAMRVGQVVWVDGQPAKEAYRLYAFPELEGAADDYRALASWARRRLESGEPWPDLVLVDGGRGQLAALERALAEEGAADRFELAAIAKAGRRKGELADQIFRPGRRNPLPLRLGSPELLFLQALRDAAHRFVLSRQRRTRRRTLDSQLQAVPGIGPKLARLLWDRFPSLDAMAAATVEDLAAVPGVGPKRAQTLKAALTGMSTGG